MTFANMVCAMAAAVFLSHCYGGAAIPKPLDLDGNECAVETFPAQTTAYNYGKLKREKLGRGLVAWRSAENTVTIGWRYLSSDSRNISFDLYRDGEPIASGLTESTQFDDNATDASVSHKYELYSNGERLAQTQSHTTIGYIEIPLRPAPPNGVTPKGDEFSYSPANCSIGDVDGDGEYEIFLQWISTMNSGVWSYTGDTFFECLKLDGTPLWANRVHFGHNIHSSKNCQGFAVGDFDGDGKAEMVIKTADGSEDAEGNLIGDYYEDEWHWINSSGQDLNGPEYLTVFSGETGKAMCTVDYKPEIGTSKEAKSARGWGDDRGNRSKRYHLTSAFLDGEHLSIVACRGIYGRTGITAYDWDGTNLVERWLFDTTNTTVFVDVPTADNYYKNYQGQGFHSLSVGDVDFDGKDEILYGSMTVDDNGSPLYSTRMGHGDAERVIQVNPMMRGLQMFVCLESYPYGCALYELENGNILWRRHAGGDTARALAGDIDGANPGYEMMSTSAIGVLDQYGNRLIPYDSKRGYHNVSMSQLIWWTGRLARDLLPGAGIYTYSLADKDRTTVVEFEGVKTLNSTFKEPSLVGDILGDWREEVIFPTADGSALRIYLSPFPTQYRFWTFLEDPVYRHSLSNQCLCHSMGSMPGFYFGPDLLGHGIWFRGCYLK